MTEFICTIRALAFGGDGIGDRDGKVVFVPGALPGERARVTPLKEHKRFIRARLIEVLDPSPDRRDSGCPHEIARGCGGCGLRHVRDAVSLHLKATTATAELHKLAPSVEWPAQAREHAVGPLDGARHRVRFQVGDEAFGFFRPHSHDLIPTPECRAVHPELLRAAEALRPLLSAQTPQPHKLLLEYRDGRRYAFWEGPSNRRQRGQLSALVSQKVFTGVLCCHRDRTQSYGETWIKTRAQVGGRDLEFHRRVGTFGQANPHANARMIERLDALLAPCDATRIVDLYAGSGNLSLVAAGRAQRVIAVEVAGEGLEGLERGAAASELTAKVEVCRRDLRLGLTNELIEAASDVVILDPPREGAREVMAQLLEANPRHVIYISCSPPDLARDAKVLAEGYRVEALEAFDMFPRTPHLEMMVHFARRDV